MSTDVAGYSRMMAENDLHTVDSLLRCIERVARCVDRFGGRVVDATGDNMLAEFPNELDALRCALEVQRQTIERNRRRTENERMRLRIGLHRGELLHYQRRLFGDVVNIAARLQSIAEPDEVVISEAVAERAALGPGRSLWELGPRSLKNIPYMVRAFRARAGSMTHAP